MKVQGGGHEIYILNALSLNCIGTNKADFLMTTSSFYEAKCWCSGKEVISAVRHGLQFIAKEMARECHLFKEVPQVKFNKGSYNVIVIQYKGPRLPEGTTVLPNGAKLEIWEGIIRVY